MPDWTLDIRLSLSLVKTKLELTQVFGKFSHSFCRNTLALPLRVILPTCIAVMVTADTCHAAELTGPDILARIHTGHPRLMMTSNMVEVLRTNLLTDFWLADRYHRQKKRADRFLTEPVSTYQLKGGDRLLDTSRRVLGRVTTLAIVYHIENDRRYFDRCWAELDAAAHFQDWDPRHFLGTAEMTAAVALGYDWLYDAWSSEQRQILRQAIINHGLKPGLHDYHSVLSEFPARVNNWNVVCNGGLALGALAVAEDAPDIAGEVLARGLASAPRCLSRFGPDGAWFEGPMYWGYATFYEAMYLGSLETACGTDFGLGDLPGTDHAGWFPVYCNGAAGGPFNFADAEEDPEPRAGPQLLWMARRFHEPRYAQYQKDCQTGRGSALEMLWGLGIERQPWQTTDPDRYFRGVEVATMRDRWDDTNGWFVGFKAGSNGVDHSHLDVGTFVLEAKGVRWAIDLGPDDYDLPGYFNNKQRWTYYRLRAEGHNTLVINPGAGPDQNLKGSGRITAFTSAAPGVELAADLTGVYPAAERVTRSLSFVRGKSVRLSDEVRLGQAGEVWWFVHTRAQVKPSADKRTLALTQAGRSLTLRLLEPASARFETGPAKPLPLRRTIENFSASANRTSNG